MSCFVLFVRIRRDGIYLIYSLDIVDRPYIIDLDTTNGTYVNSNRIPPSRYVELFHSDVIKFGYSTREYVFLQEEQAEKDAE